MRRKPRAAPDEDAPTPARADAAQGKYRPIPASYWTSRPPLDTVVPLDESNPALPYYQGEGKPCVWIRRGWTPQRLDAEMAAAFARCVEMDGFAHLEGLADELDLDWDQLYEWTAFQAREGAIAEDGVCTVGAGAWAYSGIAQKWLRRVHRDVGTRAGRGQPGAIWYAKARYSMYDVPSGAQGGSGALSVTINLGAGALPPGQTVGVQVVQDGRPTTVLAALGGSSGGILLDAQGNKAD